MAANSEQKPVIERADKVADLKNKLHGAFSQGGADESAAIPPSKYRHPKEQFYFMISAITGGIVWAFIVFAIINAPQLIITFTFFGLMIFIMLRMMKAMFSGNALCVNEKQCPELYAEVKRIAGQLGVNNIPYVFVVNGDGALNAMAIRLVGKGYVVLLGNLVDHYLREGHKEEIQFVIAHELAHHAAGHTALWKIMLTGIAAWIPFLGKAYLRACEYTCDRAGVLSVKSVASAEKALMSFAHGSEALKGELNVDAFMEQDQHIPGFIGFLMEIGYTHPRLTRRVAGVRNFAKS